MNPFKTASSIATPLDRTNVDTDQIIPKQFLKSTERTGFGKNLFYGWRYDSKGEPVKDFILNNPAYDGSQVLVAGENFGCGSSREHAAWAILDRGFSVVAAPSFADIFYNNCIKNGILPVRLEEKSIATILKAGMRGVMLRIHSIAKKKKSQVNLLMIYSPRIKEFCKCTRYTGTRLDRCRIPCGFGAQKNRCK